MIEPHELYLSPKVAEVLAAAVALARTHQVMTLTCTYLVDASLAGTNRVFVSVGGDSRAIEQLNEDPLLALTTLGMVVADADKHHLFLTKQAIAWFEYTQKDRFGRFAYRGWRMGKFWIGAAWGAVFGFVVAFLSLSQAILQIVQLLHDLGYLSKLPLTP